MNWLRKVMYGRYGSDKLSFGLVIVYVILATITFVSKVSVFIWIGYILVLWSLFRSFSRNIYKRQMENRLFLRWSGPFVAWVMRQVNKVKYRKTHKYFRCPKCKQHLRALKGKGVKTISCPKCKASFEKRT